MDRIKLKLLKIVYVDTETEGEYFGYISGFTAVSATGKSKQEVGRKLTDYMKDIFIMANPELKLPKE